MSDDKRTISIEIMDKQYHVKCPPEEISALQQSALYLNDKMRKIHNNGILRSSENIAIMSALNVAYEFLQLQQQQEQYIDNMSQRLQLLQGKIEEALMKQEEIDV